MCGVWPPSFSNGWGEQMPPPFRVLPHLALFLAMLVWSLSFIALKIALSAYSPLTVMAGRMLAASLICLPVLKHLSGSLRHASTRRALLLCVLCEPCLYHLCEAFALRYTSPSQAGMVMALLPLSVAVGAGIFLRERLGWRVWAGSGLAVFGIGWMTAGSVATEGSSNPLLGNFLESLAVLFGTAYTLCAKYLAGRLRPIQLTSAMAFAGAFFFVPLSFLPLSLQPVSLEMALPPWMPALAVIFLGSVVTFAGYGLNNYGICHLSASRAAAYTNLIPVFTLLMGVAWLHDLVLPMQYAAAALVIAGVILSQSGMAGRGEKQEP
jgi:drug/metabolite transporter (DMT)-like permease